MSFSEAMTFDELCAVIRRYLDGTPTEGGRYGDWRDRLDELLSEVRSELSQAYDRREYEMTQSEADALSDALHSAPPSQERLKRAWSALGEMMGFDAATVQCSPKGGLFFTAIPKKGVE